MRFVLVLFAALTTTGCFTMTTSNVRGMVFARPAHEPIPSGWALSMDGEYIEKKWLPFRPVEGVTITCTGCLQTDHFTTDARGYFMIARADSRIGSHITLRFEHAGYVPVEADVELKNVATYGQLAPEPNLFVVFKRAP